VATLPPSLTLDADRESSAQERREPRTRAVRIVEYTHFPRTEAGAAPHVGFTRDLSDSGMCIGVAAAEEVGSLLRVTLRGIDGIAQRPGVERVVWCARAPDGRHWLGLERIEGGEPD
jgi:hypothetical protein